MESNSEFICSPYLDSSIYPQAVVQEVIREGTNESHIVIKEEAGRTNISIQKNSANAENKLLEILNLILVKALREKII